MYLKKIKIRDINIFIFFFSFVTAEATIGKCFAVASINCLIVLSFYRFVQNTLRFVEKA